jgi:hypothetical protein
MSSFAKIASGVLLSLTIATPGCLAASGDEDVERTDEAGLLDQSSGTTPTSPPCGPGTLIQSLGYPLPPMYGGGFYPGYYGAGLYGGGFGGGYGGGYMPGYYGGGFYGPSYGPSFYNPGYYVPGSQNGQCGCAPSSTSNNSGSGSGSGSGSNP